MVRQYIGARYVTKIYENSQDASSAEWEANVNFEPLTMVTYNFGSYLSKKEVPASVGDPAHNPAYWVQTGFYNGQITSLQEQITAINAILTGFETEFDSDKITTKLGIVQTSATDTNEALNIINSADQANNGERALVVHNYTDAEGFRLDHVGNNVMMTLVNAHNAIKRPDKASTFHGDAEYMRMLVQHDYDGDEEYSQEVIGILDKNGDIWRSGYDNTGNPARNHTFHIATNKLGGGTWAFNIETYNSNPYFMCMNDNNHTFLRIEKNGDNGFSLGQGADANGVFGIPAANITSMPNGMQINLGAGSDFYINKNGQYQYIDYDNNVCNSTARPSTGLHNGMIWREADTKKLIWYYNGAWYDAAGNAV